MMIEREDVQTILRRWFPDAPDYSIDSATSRIVGLSDGWVEVTSKEEEMGYHYSSTCPNICYLADQVDHGAELRLFLRRAAPTRDRSIAPPRGLEKCSSSTS